MNPLSVVQWAWEAFPWYVQAGAIGYIAFTSIGGTLSIYNFTKGFAGKWAIPAMASLVLPLAFWAWSLWRKPKGKPVETDEIWPDPDKPVKPKKKRPTLFGK